MRQAFQAALLLLLAAVPISRADTHAPPAFADPDRLARIRTVLPRLDALYREHADAEHLPGFTYGVVVDGALIHRLDHGKAGLDPDRAVSAETRFRVASMTKSVTALAILRLRDAGRLSLEDPLERHLPEFARVARPTGDTPPVTLRRLLAMEAGLPQDDPWGDRKLHETPDQLRALVGGGLTFSTPPGTAWEYSNLGYTLLGEVVTRVSGRPYQRYITEEILRPLGMVDTVWDPGSVPEGRMAIGQRWEDGEFRPEPLLGDGTFGAMGGLVSTLGDWARYAAFHLNAWPPRDDPDPGPVSRGTLREMHRPIAFVTVTTDTPDGGAPVPRATGYGFGLSWNRDGREVAWIRHAGGLPGYGSEWRFLPAHGIALIAFANRTYAPMSRVNQRAMDLLLAAATPPSRRLAPSAILERRREQLWEILRDWTAPAAAAALAPNVFLDADRDHRAAESRELLERIGAVREVTPVEPENHLRGRFRVHGENGELEVFFTLTPEAEPRIQDIRLRLVPSGQPVPPS